MKFQFVVVLVVIFYTFAVSMLFLFQRNLLYPAPQAFEETPAERGLQYDEVNLDTGNGETTHGWFIPADNPIGAVIYSHGNGDNVGSSLDEAQFLHNLGYSVMLYDYGGYGLSSGAPTEQRNYADLRAAWKYVTEERGFPGKKVVLFGISLGGGVSCQIASEVEAAAIVLEGTFTSIPDAARSRFPLINFEKIILDKYRNIDKISSIGEPVLIYHSINDSTVPIELGQMLFDAAQEPRKFVQLTASHAKGIRDEPELYASVWTEFVTPLLPE